MGKEMLTLQHTAGDNGGRNRKVVTKPHIERAQSGTIRAFVWTKVSTVNMGLRKDRDCNVTYDNI